MNAVAKEISREVYRGLFDPLRKQGQKTRTITRYVVDMGGINSREYDSIDEAEESARAVNENCKATGYADAGDWFRAMTQDPMAGVDDV
jgi:hypothetical protein